MQQVPPTTCNIRMMQYIYIMLYHLIYISYMKLTYIRQAHTPTFFNHHQRRSRRSSSFPPATRAAAWSPSAARTSIGTLLQSLVPTQSWDLLATASGATVHGWSFDDLGSMFGRVGSRPLHGCRLLHGPTATATPAATATSSSATATSTATSTMRKIIIFFKWILAPGSCHGLGLLGW